MDPTDKALAVIAGAPVVYVVVLLIGRLLRRRAGVQLGATYQFFAASAALFLPLWALGINYYNSWFNLLRELGVLTFLLAVLVLLALVRRFVWELYFENSRRIAIPKFLSELVSLGIVVLALLGVSNVAYGHDASVLLTGSTVAAAIIGFAMQDLLGNIISVVALQTSKPYREGDWLFVDGQYAEVMEINWRSTRLRNNDNIYLDIPNSTIVKNTIVNVNYHTRFYAMRIRVGLEYEYPPNLVKQVLWHATANAKGVLKTPTPKVFLVDFADSSVTYEVKFYMNDHSKFNDTADAVRTAIWYELKRKNLNIPYPVRTLRVDRRKPEAANSTVLQKVKAMVRNQAFFGCLTPEQIDHLLKAAALEQFGKDETVIEKGTSGSSMFILVDGRASVFLTEDASGDPVASFNPGDCFGEMSLLTGEPRSATVVAQTDLEVLEISKDGIAPLLEANSALSQTLSELLARRRMENEGALNREGTNRQVVAEQERQYAATILSRITNFFSL